MKAGILQFFRRVSVWLVAVILGVALLEGTARVLAPKPAPPSFPLFADEKDKTGEQIQTEYFEDLARAIKIRWQPYVHWRLEPYQGKHIAIDAEGFRATWNPRAPDTSPETPTTETKEKSTANAAPPEIWTLGGSGLWGVGARDDMTVSSLLSRELSSRGVPARVKSFAVVGYVSTQEVLTLEDRLAKGGRPAVVLFYDGANDILASYFERTAGVTIIERMYRDNPLLVFAQRSGINRLSRFWLHQAGSSIRRAQPMPAGEFERLVNETANVYVANVERVRRLGREYGFQSLFILQPLVFFKKDKHPDEAAAEKVDGFLHIGGFELDTPGTEFRDFFIACHDRLIASSERKDAARLIDLQGVLENDKEPRFLDFCHTTEAANHKIARVVADSVVAAMNTSKPVTTKSSNFSPPNKNREP